MLQLREKPLHGVVISVAKKLIGKQTEYNKIADSLGAEYRWSYDSSCTHYIFQVGSFMWRLSEGKCKIYQPCKCF